MNRPLAWSSRRGDVAEIVLDRPERHNSLVPALLDDLHGAIETVAADDGAAAVVLRGNGRSFSTGGDVRGFYEAEDVGAYADGLVAKLNECVLGLYRMHCPIVCLVQGLVTGGSMGLVLASDVVLLDEAASFTPWYGPVGFSPDGGWTALAPAVIGRGRTAQLLFSNRTLTAREALDWGIADRVVPLDVLAEVGRVTAERIARMRPGALRSARSLLHADAETVAAKLDAERAAFVTQIQSPEAREGMRAFLEGSR
ncbi:MAG: enoyl-CoA hydratase/isomerase family protein [Pseudomonadota bacterium]